MPAGLQISGLVVDENQAPVPGAVVNLYALTPVPPPTAPAATTITDIAGKFTLAAVPPGSYRCDVQKPGFFHSETRVDVAAASIQLRLVLPHEQEVRQQYEVASAANPIEAGTTATPATLGAASILNLPVASVHDVTAIMPTLPQVVLDNADELHLAGARTDQSAYELDGFAIGDPANGSFDARLDPNAVQLISVQSAGISAANAEAGAGVLALETQNGDDHFRYNLENVFPGITTQQGLHLGNWFPLVSFSGPLRRGRLWYSEAISLQHNYAILSGLPTNADTTEQWMGDTLTRIEWRSSDRSQLYADVLGNIASGNHSGLGLAMPVSTTLTTTSRLGFASLLEQWTPAQALVQFGVAVDSRENSAVPLGTAPYVLQPQGSSGNYFQTLHAHSRRDQAQVSLALPGRHKWGRHDLEIGANVERLGYTQQALREPYTVESATGTLLQAVQFAGPGTLALRPSLWGAYAQDGWQLNRRLRVQPSLRVDRESIAAAPLWQPRIAAAWLPHGDDRSKLAASAGLYFQPADLSQYGEAFDQSRLDTFYTAAGGIMGTATTLFALPQARLPPQRFRTLNASWQQRLGVATFLTLSATDRRESDGWAYQPPPDAASGVFLLSEQRNDRYDSGGVRLRHDFSGDSSAYIDYTRSRADTNEALNYTLASPIFAPQQAGPQPWDAPNRLISSGWKPVHFQQLLLSYVAEYRTGFPFNLVNQQQDLVGPPGSTRFPDYFRLDVGVERPFVFRSHIWAVRLTVVNLTDRDNPTSVINNVDAPNYLAFAASQSRALTLRLRLVGRK